MKKLTTLFILLSAFSIQVISQSKTKIVRGPEYEAKRSTLEQIIGMDAGGYYIVRSEKKDDMFERLDKDMNTVQSVALPELTYNEKDRSYTGSLFFNGKIYALSSAEDKKEDKMFYFAQEVDKSTMQLDEKNMKTLLEYQYEKRSEIYFSAPFDPILSPDRTKLLLFSNKTSRFEKKEEKEKFGFKVYQGNFELMWEKDVELPFPAGLFDLEYVKVDNKGNTYVTGIEYSGKRRTSKKDGDPNYKYWVVSYLNKGMDAQKYELTLGDKFITDMKIHITDNGDIIAAGFYSEKGTYSVKGAFYLSVDAKTRQVKQKNLKEFTLDFITEGMTENQKERAEKKEAKGKSQELYQFDLDDIVVRKDGGAILIAEQFYIVVTTHQTKNGTYTTYTYYYNDIIVVSVNPDGTIAWNTKIPKRQITKNDGGYYSSYVSADCGNSIYLVYNDNPKNTMPGSEKDDKIYNYAGRKESSVVLAIIDATGKVSKEVLIKTSESDEALIRPKMSEQIEPHGNEILLFGEKGKTYQFSKVVLKQL